MGPIPESLKARIILVAWFVAFIMSDDASSHDRSFEECNEGGEFIFHAAQSRDAGLPREEFVNQFELDVIAIQQFPVEYRWFVQDEKDEALLRRHVYAVWDTPSTPGGHQQIFLFECVRQP